MATLSSVHVAGRFQRSIRIDADLADPLALEGYVCPPSAAEALRVMARHVRETGQAAFTWTGPYGSGKSSLVVALSAMLAGSAQRRASAIRILGADLTKAVQGALPPKSGGWRVLPVVGRREDPVQVVGEALAEHGFARVPRSGWTEKSVLDAVACAAAEAPSQRGGLIIFLDEMGKFLEGAAQHGLDIHLFQQLAEAAARSNRRLVVVGILHQAFQEYATRLSRDLREEWSKVQGRFVDLVVNAAGDEQLELLSRAIVSERWPNKPGPVAEAVARVVRRSRPGAPDDLARTFEACWPLHPVTAALLGPLSRRRFGQNQRSLFGFLNSAEPFAFQDFLKDGLDDQLYTPDRLFDYLRTNLEPSILSSPDGHRWSTAVEAIDRCEALGGSVLHLALLKAIALVDVFRERSGLVASHDLLSWCLGPRVSDVTAMLADLAAWSLIIYRRHAETFALFAGSDFDIEQALSRALDGAREIDFKELRSLAGLQPVVAKRHYHRTGALRWFDIDLIPLAELQSSIRASASTNGATGRFLLMIATEGETPLKARKICRAATVGRKDVAVGISRQEWKVQELAREFLALNHILEDRPELRGDQVARREVVARLATARTRLEESLRRAFDSAEWYRDGSAGESYSYAALNALASEIADGEFPCAPALPNELLNRIKPSSTAVAAQKALLKRMVSLEGTERLGIEGFPAEGGLFESVLLKSGLYRGTSAGWRFSSPSPNEDPCRLAPLWDAATSLLQANNDRAVPVSELFSVWRDRPFGVREGLLSVLAVAYMMSRRDDLAWYREGIFQARFTDVDVDYLTIDSSLIQLRWMDLSDLSRRILSGLADVVRDVDGNNALVNLEPIDVARGLVGIYDRLTPWAKRTYRLSANALRVRELFKQARDPNRLLFNDIPATFSEPGTVKTAGEVDSVMARVREGLLELTEAYSGLLAKNRQLLLSELQVPNHSPNALSELRDRAANIRELSGDFRLNAFTNRLTQFTGTELDVEGIVGLAANKPLRDCVDADVDRGSVEMTDLAQRFVRAEAFARVKGRADKRQALAVIVGREGRPTPLSFDFHVTEPERPEVKTIVDCLRKTLDKGSSPAHLVLAALAELSARYIDEDLPGAKQRVAQR